MALSRRAAARLAWSMAGTATLLSIAGLGYTVASWHVPLPADIFGGLNDGALEVQNAPGSGTTVAGRVPVGEQLR